MKSFNSPTSRCRVRWMDLPGKGVPLVFVHGIGCASSYEYPRIAADKQFDGQRAILLDLPGCGYSEKSLRYAYTIKEQAAVVAELVTHLKLEHCFLYGHSMGGSISIEAAALLGDRLGGLIVSEPNFHPGGGMFSREICSVSEQEFIDTKYPTMIAQESGPWAGSLAVDAPWAVWRGASSLIVGDDWLKKFESLNKAKLLIFGEHSLPDDDFSQVSAMGIPTTILPACGHSMSWENPAALASVLASFCRVNERPYLKY